MFSNNSIFQLLYWEIILAFIVWLKKTTFWQWNWISKDFGLITLWDLNCLLVWNSLKIVSNQPISIWILLLLAISILRMEITTFYCRMFWKTSNGLILWRWLHLKWILIQFHRTLNRIWKWTSFLWFGIIIFNRLLSISWLILLQNSFSFTNKFLIII